MFFNVGDKVVYLGPTDLDGESLTKGEELVICGIVGDKLVVKSQDGPVWFYHESLFEKSKEVVMSKFKVGDVVEVVGNEHHPSHSHPIGLVGTITDVNERGNFWVHTDLKGQFVNPRDLKLVEDKPRQTQDKIASDGGPSDYYDFPSNCVTLNDLIEYKEMSFAHGNIFKAAYRLGHKEGITLEYDLNKIIYYANRMLDQLKPKEGGAASAAKKGK